MYTSSAFLSCRSCGIHYVRSYPMNDIGLFTPIIPITAVVATCCYSIISGGAIQITRWPLIWFLTVSGVAYAYFMVATHGTLPQSYRKAFVWVYTAYVMAFVLALLLSAQPRRRLLVFPYALFSGAVIIGTAMGSFIVLALIFFLSGVIQDS